FGISGYLPIQRYAPTRQTPSTKKPKKNLRNLRNLWINKLICGNLRNLWMSYLSMISMESPS
ncbi:MAG: hypothetical protein WCZ10_11535, partial [Desulfobulbaceae bacterium]